MFLFFIFDAIKYLFLHEILGSSILNKLKFGQDSEVKAWPYFIFLVDKLCCLVCYFLVNFDLKIAEPPSKPTQLQISRTQRGAMLTWEAPKNDGGRNDLKYRFADSYTVGLLDGLDLSTINRFSLFKYESTFKNKKCK